MSMRINKADYSPEDGFLYYVTFKPNMQLGDETVAQRIPVHAAVSLSETGDLADLTFLLPKQFRNEFATSYIRKDDATNVIDDRILITIPGLNGDAVIETPAKLDLDASGRIVGMEIQWRPDQPKGNA